MKNKGRFMNKFKKTIATALACALVFGPASKVLADEDTSNQSLFNILTNDIIENQEEKSETPNEQVIKDYENDPLYKEEFDSRYNLLEKILVAKELREIDETPYIDLANKKVATKEDLEKALKDLEEKINTANEKVAIDVDIDGLHKAVEDYILYGKLFFLDSLNKKDIKNLYLFYEATVNSYTFTRANDEEKKPLMPTLEKIYDYILEIDGKVKEKIEISEEDKEKTSELINNLEKLLENKIKEDPKHESTKVEKTAFLTGGEEVDGTLNENSAFYKSEREGIKEAYKNLPESQRTFLDNINTNNNDYIEDSEIEANGQYTLPLEDDNFIKPFYGKPEGNKEKTVEMESKEVEGEKSKTSTSQTATTAQNPNSTTPPETVTLSQGENTPGTEKDKKEDAPTTLTNPASQVKTGIKGIGYLGIVLVVAIIAFVVLNKKKEKK